MASNLLRYAPVGLDQWAPKTDLRAGDKVRVVESAGCPQSGTMRHVFVEDEAGQWKGLVLRASLRNIEG